ncbi:hypothetical protein [Pseudomonas sp. KNUC1026]|uniref:hypothetical protein n=1 Tax=Pseudomonas sp. KNUC1026 TaxID=2893890 RepID=UPI001F207703|nr:hypothetical protein [Pseudomonas sp. KNUC1026]UFH51326.1 hypothetical protein LN139_10090 [Pseudomonas sp. KNUC1026]
MDLSNNRLQQVAPLIQALRDAPDNISVLYIRMDENPVQGGQVAQLQGLGVYVLHRADFWIAPDPVLTRAVRIARGNSVNATFLDWVSEQVAQEGAPTAAWREFLAHVFDARHGYSRERAAIMDFEQRLSVLRHRLFSQIHDYWAPNLAGLSRQLQAFEAAQRSSLAAPEDRFDALLQHNYRHWQEELRDLFGPEQAASHTVQSRFLDWLLRSSHGLDQNALGSTLGEQDWRPYLSLLDPRWDESVEQWEQALQWLEEATAEPMDSGELPSALVDQMIAPSDELPRAFLGLGAPGGCCGACERCGMAHRRRATVGATE